MTDNQAIFAVAIIAVITCALRFAPFILFSGKRKTPAIITYLGSVLPCAIMGMLVIYCLKDTTFKTVGGFLPQLISVAVVVSSYIWKKNSLLSIVLGTACYMIILHL